VLIVLIKPMIKNLISVQYPAKNRPVTYTNVVSRYWFNFLSVAKERGRGQGIHCPHPPKFWKGRRQTLSCFEIAGGRVVATLLPFFLCARNFYLPIFFAPAFFKRHQKGLILQRWGRLDWCFLKICTEFVNNDYRVPTFGAVYKVKFCYFCFFKFKFTV